jgi:hypothetical protein
LPSWSVSIHKKHIKFYLYFLNHLFYYVCNKELYTGIRHIEYNLTIAIDPADKNL